MGEEARPPLLIRRLCPSPKFSPREKREHVVECSTMKGGFTRYLEAVARELPEETGGLIRGDLNLTLLDWYTDGIPAREAARRIRRSLDLS